MSNLLAISEIIGIAGASAASGAVAYAAACHAIDWVKARKEGALRRVRLKAVRAAIGEAQTRKRAVSNGLKQPNKSSTIRYLNEAISRLTYEQLQLEAMLGGKGAQ